MYALTHILKRGAADKIVTLVGRLRARAPEGGLPLGRAAPESGLLAPRPRGARERLALSPALYPRRASGRGRRLLLGGGRGGVGG